MGVRVQAEPFDFADLAGAFADRARGAGAVVTFTGIVRDLADAPLRYMEIEHYPGMTERSIAAMRAEAGKRWQLTDSLIVHRYGRLAPGEPIVLVATAAPHRREAFAAADFLMDYLKSRAPFWKKEVTETGADWVAAQGADEAALGRWT